MDCRGEQSLQGSANLYSHCQGPALPRWACFTELDAAYVI